MTHRAHILWLAAGLLAATAPAAPAQQPDTTRPIAFRPPELVSGFQLVGRRNSPEAGAELRYQVPRKADWIDVYVYPAIPSQPCDRACDSVAANEQADGFAMLIPELLRRGYYDSLRVEADRRVDLPSGGQTLHARHLRLRGGREGRVISSQFYLVPAGPVLVKVRATYAPDAAMDSVVDEFTRGFVRTALQRTQACTGGPPASNGIEMTVELAEPPAEVRPRVVAALRKLGYELEPGPADADAWRTLPVHDWPARDRWDALRAQPHPGVAVWVEARPKGNGTELRVGAEPTCGVPQKREIETSTALVAAMEVMMEFPDARK